MTTEIKHPCIRDGTECRWPECVKWQTMTHPQISERVVNKIKMEKEEKEDGK